ncbi:class I SAM-dependent methyltransferase, partial [Roseobacter sp.]
MSRLESMRRRLTAQIDGINWAAETIAPLNGDVLELGLGNGRTYDHLRDRLPNRRIWVIDRILQP